MYLLCILLFTGYSILLLFFSFQLSPFSHITLSIHKFSHINLIIDHFLAGTVNDLLLLHSEASKFTNPLNIEKCREYLASKSTALLDFKFIEDGLPLWLYTYRKFM